MSFISLAGSDDFGLRSWGGCLGFHFKLSTFQFHTIKIWKLSCQFLKIWKLSCQFLTFFIRETDDLRLLIWMAFPDSHEPFHPSSSSRQADFWKHCQPKLPGDIYFQRPLAEFTEICPCHPKYLETFSPFLFLSPLQQLKLFRIKMASETTIVVEKEQQAIQVEPVCKVRYENE